MTLNTTDVDLNSPPQAPPPAGLPTVLVLDPSVAQRSLIASIVSRMDYPVLLAETPLEALEICQGPDGSRIGMIISAWQMEGMDGPEFCQAFRDLNAENYTYVILTTARSDRRAKAVGLDAGADDFVARPIDLGELRARIRAGQRMLSMQEALLHRNHEVATTLYDLQKIQSAMNRDLVEARKLQQSFLPEDETHFGPHRLCLRLVTQGQVGGDLLGHFELTDGRLAVFSIDVSGHGIASALLTGRLAGLFSEWNPGHNIASPTPGAPPDPPEALMSRVNESMLGDIDSDLYFTCALVYLDPMTGEVELCQAGHPHPLIRRADGSVEAFGNGGPPVGLIPGAPFDRVTAKLAPGDSMLLYSDGLTECEDSWGDMLEEEGLKELVARAEGDPKTVIDTIHAGVAAHAGIAGFDDDVSMLLLSFGDPDVAGANSTLLKQADAA